MIDAPGASAEEIAAIVAVLTGGADGEGENSATHVAPHSRWREAARAFPPSEYS